MESISGSQTYSSTALLVGVLGIMSFVFYQGLKGSKRSLPLPPGPRKLPVLGNALDFPKSEPWVTFARWGERYGPIVHLSAVNQSVIILNDPSYAVDMLDKKSRIYSDRPTLMLSGRLIGWEELPGMAPVGEQWSEYRKMFNRFMGTKAKVEGFGELLEDETNAYLRRILDGREEWVDHSCKFAGSIVLMLAYGIKPTDDGAKGMIRAVNEAMGQFSETSISGAFMVDIFPILRHVPSWLPGAGWKRKIPRYKKSLQLMVREPYEWAEMQMVARTNRPSFLSTYLHDQSVTPEQSHAIKWAAAGIYGGGADTTVAGLECFFLAMTLHIEEQKKAQTEIDNVIGMGRLPTLRDRECLPYTSALLTEVQRRYNFAMLGVPHASIEDDVHEGYFIPKGSLVMVNVWQFLKDPKVYPDPDRFSPERYLASDGHELQKDPREYIFGFGRRACPGIHLADASLWLACTSILGVYDIRPPTKNGQPVLPAVRFTSEAISHPEHFECMIKPRSAAAEALIQSSA